MYTRWAIFYARERRGPTGRRLYSRMDRCCPWPRRYTAAPTARLLIPTEPFDPEAATATRGDDERWRCDGHRIPRKKVRRILAEGDVGLRELLGGKQQEGGLPH